MKPYLVKTEVTYGRKPSGGGPIPSEILRSDRGLKITTDNFEKVVSNAFNNGFLFGIMFSALLVLLAAFLVA